MKTLADLADIVTRIRYLDWTFAIIEQDYRPHLQLQFKAACSKDGIVKDWTSRKWPLSFHMTKSEVVATAFKAVMTAIEHEARENFRYKGRSIFGPHIDVEALHFVANTEDVRT